MKEYGFAEDVKRDFHDSFPDEFLRDIVRLLATGYSGTYTECYASHEPPEARDLYPVQRRAFIEGQIRKLAEDYPEIRASPEQNSVKSHSYTLLRSKDVMLTVSAVPHHNERIRRAEFRETYARASELKLFDETPSKGSLLYAILLHGPDPLNLAKPAFAHAVFPDKEATTYVARIDLFERFSTLVTELWSGQEETIKDELDFQLRSETEEQGNTETGEGQAG